MKQIPSKTTSLPQSIQQVWQVFLGMVHNSEKAVMNSIAKSASKGGTLLSPIPLPKAPTWFWIEHGSQYIHQEEASTRYILTKDLWKEQASTLPTLLFCQHSPLLKICQFCKKPSHHHYPQLHELNPGPLGMGGLRISSSKRNMLASPKR